MVLRHLANLRVVLLISLPLIVIGCSSPEAQKRRHFERGNQYVTDKRDEFAVIEYANAVRIDPKFGEARLKLAETYERMNNLRAAFPEFVRAADALPDSRDAQLKATEVLLLGRRFEDAKARSAGLLAKNPQDIDAILLHANALAALKDPAGAVAEIEDALKIDPTESRVYLNLGAVRMTRGDVQEAEASFRKALSLDPSSVNAHLAFANFLWASRRPSEAENEIKQVLAAQPRHLLANRMLGTLYLATNRAVEAEQPLKAVAEVSALPAAKFQLAQYYLNARRNDDANKLLTELAANPETAGDAETMLASVDYAAGRQADAHARLDKLLARAPKDPRALLLKARWLGAEKKLDEALNRANAATVADPQSAEAQFVLGMIHDLRREAADAIKAFNETLRLNPRAVVAQLELSRLNLATGNEDTALRYAEEARQTAPGNASVGVALARSLLAKGDLARADKEIAALLRDQPGSATAHALNGTLQARKGNRAGATKAFERTLELAPGNLEAITGLVALDLQKRDFAAAHRRIETELGRQPERAELLALSAQAFIVAGESDKAEPALRRAVASDPRFVNGFAMLAQLYLKQRRLDEARGEFEGMVKRDPRAVGPRTMVGVILETQGQREEAKRWYEATVAELSNAPVIANNLAFIYAEQGTNLDVALQLASSAKQQMPDSPDVDDTLGWVYYKKDLAAMAVRPLEESLAKKPDNPEILYHLGLTYAKIGEKAKAREALSRALKANPQMAAAETARQTLAAVSQ